VTLLTGEESAYRMLDFAKEMQDFMRASEHLLCLPRSRRLSDDEGILIDYYLKELTARFGAPDEEKDGSVQIAPVGFELLTKTE